MPDATINETPHATKARTVINHIAGAVGVFVRFRAPLQPDVNDTRSAATEPPAAALLSPYR
jgi:hypothetical protein